ncbi:MAG: hypothetical protein DRP87_04910 [Spirochaetes bacterium]|nr:MAG: hypothetical protein DRP87_04910 [Spirochaetota bacterium]
MKKPFPVLPVNAVIMVSLVACACIPIPDHRKLAAHDLKPPTLLGVEPVEPEKVVLRFDEPVAVVEGTILLIPETALKEVVRSEDTLVLEFFDAQTPGAEYQLEAAVQDDSGNSMNFITRFYGFNPNVPDVLINELTTRGSSTHPDLVELFVCSEGNMAGVCLYEGTPGDWDHRFMFPSLHVKKGDYILVHFKPQGIEEEKNETGNKMESGGLDASPHAYDFWVKGGSGISGNNGVISLYSNPAGTILDGVLYSNRTSESDENYRGFGRASTLFRAEELVYAGGWKIAGEEVAPEDAVNPDGSTATRSICRDSNSTDTDSAEDWHIVPTGSYTFGELNSNEVYEP